MVAAKCVCHRQKLTKEQTHLTDYRRRDQNQTLVSLGLLNDCFSSSCGYICTVSIGRLIVNPVLFGKHSIIWCSWGMFFRLLLHLVCQFPHCPAGVVFLFSCKGCIAIKNLAAWLYSAASSLIVFTFCIYCCFECRCCCSSRFLL